MGVGASTAFDRPAAASTIVSASAAPALDGPADRRPCEPQRGCAPRGRREWQRHGKQSGDEAQPLRAQLVDRAKRPGDRGVGCEAGRRFRKHGIWPSRRAARFDGIGSLAFPEAPDTRAEAPDTRAEAPDTRAEAPASREAPSPSAPPTAAASPSAATTSATTASAPAPAPTAAATTASAAAAGEAAP
jgi:hypothetical protein